MAVAWTRCEEVETAEGLLELRQQGADTFLICIDGRVLMNSRASRSEVALATLGCAALRTHPRPRVLVGGLGMGITLRAALDCLPPDADLQVAELQPAMLRWCRGPLRDLTHSAVFDARVRVRVEDVAASIARAGEQGGAARFDAILLDLYEGPHAADDARAHPHYGSRALERARAALVPQGRLAVWGEDPDAAFEGRLARQGFQVERQRPGRGGRRHVVTVATLPR